MKILYISYLSERISEGPNWSVPASILAQSREDDVLWINMTDVYIEHWSYVSAYHNIKEFGKLTLDKLPEHFMNPDLVVFEGVYFIRNVFFAYTLRNRNIPYIIVPRCSLTKEAQNNKKWLKKKIFNFLLFNSFINNATAIQYLTEKEYESSSMKWNKQYFIIPNGVELPQIWKTSFNQKKQINALFIGRIDVYHKGLDLLLEACKRIKETLRGNSFVITLYGPLTETKKQFEMTVRKEGMDDIMKIGDEISGKEKEDAIMKADCFILTSRFEGHPMALIEALSYGLPCMVTEGTNMRTEICKCNAGWGCDNNVEDICFALMKVIQDKDDYIYKSWNARTLASEYNWAALAKKTHISIEKLLFQ